MAIRQLDVTVDSRIFILYLADGKNIPDGYLTLWEKGDLERNDQMAFPALLNNPVPLLFFMGHEGHPVYTKGTALCSGWFLLYPSCSHC